MPIKNYFDALANSAAPRIWETLEDDYAFTGPVTLYCVKGAYGFWQIVEGEGAGDDRVLVSGLLEKRPEVGNPCGEIFGCHL